MANCWRCEDNGWYPVARLDENAKWITARKACKSCSMKPEDYTAEYVYANPIPARCKKCGSLWVDGNGNGAIRSPSLVNCACFYCHGKLVEIETGDMEAGQFRFKKLIPLQPTEQPKLFQ
ncbi:MAG TPA: hypothetical protein VEF04_04760 [Blastocatellia bacterium]|nr:hypothetical protein [Blastocatellia bacterium]